MTIDHVRPSVSRLGRRFDRRTIAMLVIATLIGAAWAVFNYASTGGARNESELRALVWTVFATPFAVFIGWVIARRWEFWLAAFSCFCLYFFTFFVSARIESLLVPAEQVGNHDFYFRTSMVIHIIGGIGFAIWRALAPRDSGHEPGK